MEAATKFSFLVLEHFFEKHPKRFTTFYSDRDNVELWEEIFKHFFQTPPVDSVVTTYPLIRRPGSCDPKWDMLFFKLNALRAQAFILKLKQREFRLNLSNLKEAV